MNPSVELSDIILNVELLSNKVISQIEVDGGYIFTKSTSTTSGIPYIEQSLRDIWYTNNCDGRFTKSYTSVVKCSHNTISLIKELNSLKDEYSALKLKSENMGFNFHSILMDTVKNPCIRDRLKTLGMSRLNINHLKRKISFFEGDEVNSVLYSRYSKGKSIQKISPEDAHTKLVKLLKKYPSSESILTQISLLGNHPHSTPLVVVRSLPPLIKVNAKIDNENHTLCTSMPIFINSKVIDSSRISFFPKPIERVKRSDSTIEDTPFLKSINVHRKL